MLKYDSKHKKATFQFEYKRLGMPAVDIDIPLDARNSETPNKSTLPTPERRVMAAVREFWQNLL